jgi:hypothetical protein
MMSKFEKFEKVLRVLLFLVALFSAAAFGINQFSSYLENYSAAKVRSAQAEQVSAEAACIDYGVPHAVVANDGTIYCYQTFYGNETVVSLEDLKEYWESQQPANDG